MVDPGFPIGVLTHWGGADFQRVHILAKKYAKMKEIDPVGGGHMPAAPPGSANGFHTEIKSDPKIRFHSKICVHSTF